jgi:hypothetical protein
MLADPDSVVAKPLSTFRKSERFRRKLAAISALTACSVDRAFARFVQNYAVRMSEFVRNFRAREQQREMTESTRRKKFFELTASRYLFSAFGAGEATSFWKRGSFRSGSNMGSSRSSSGGVLIGIASVRCWGNRLRCGRKRKPCERERDENESEPQLRPAD